MENISVPELFTVIDGIACRLTVVKRALDMLIIMDGAIEGELKDAAHDSQIVSYLSSRYERCQSLITTIELLLQDVLDEGTEAVNAYTKRREMPPVA